MYIAVNVLFVRVLFVYGERRSGRILKYGNLN